MEHEILQVQIIFAFCCKRLRKEKNKKKIGNCHIKLNYDLNQAENKSKDQEECQAVAIHS